MDIPKFLAPFVDAGLITQDEANRPEEAFAHLQAIGLLAIQVAMAATPETGQHVDLLNRILQTSPARADRVPVAVHLLGDTFSTPSEKLVTLFHVGSSPAQQRRWSAQLIEGLEMTVFDREGKSTPLWAINMPIGETGPWVASQIFRESPPQAVTAYHLRRIGTVDAKAVVVFEGVQPDDLTFYGNIPLGKSFVDTTGTSGFFELAYQTAFDHANTHGGRLPLEFQNRVEIPSGTRWVLPPLTGRYTRERAQGLIDAWNNFSQLLPPTLSPTPTKAVDRFANTGELFVVRGIPPSQVEKNPIEIVRDHIEKGGLGLDLENKSNIDLLLAALADLATNLSGITMAEWGPIAMQYQILQSDAFPEHDQKIQFFLNQADFFMGIILAARRICPDNWHDLAESIRSVAEPTQQKLRDFQDELHRLGRNDDPPPPIGSSTTLASPQFTPANQVTFDTTRPPSKGGKNSAHSRHLPKVHHHVGPTSPLTTGVDSFCNVAPNESLATDVMMLEAI